MGLDFKRAADLFVSTERELAMALGTSEQEVRRFRSDPGSVPRDVLARLGDVLVQRGRGMARVGEMLREDVSGADGNGPGS
ncbi:MAG TPA: hypothetical protein VK966_13665 [Longimicrobiales bacterium]|nr:hypothetical protein [Longimicrobiales bacterium]